MAPQLFRNKPIVSNRDQSLQVGLGILMSRNLFMCRCLDFQLQQNETSV